MRVEEGRVHVKPVTFEKAVVQGGVQKVKAAIALSQSSSLPNVERVQSKRTLNPFRKSFSQFCDMENNYGSF